MGFNHEVLHDGRTFHVQTEDSGRHKGHIFTHVFHSGAVVASSRVPYEDGSTDVKVAQLLEESHASMLRLLVSGALDGPIGKVLEPSTDEAEPALALAQHDPGSIEARLADVLPEPTEVSVESDQPVDDITLRLRDLQSDVPGTIGIALIDQDGRCRCTDRSAFDIECAAAGALLLVRTKVAVMKKLGVPGGIEDMLITLATQYHLIRPIDDATVLYMVIDRRAGNLAMARHKLALAAEQLKAPSAPPITP